MKRHRNLHTNTKAFSCETCGKSFARADALGKHQKLGTSDGCSSRYSESGAEDRRASLSSNGSRFSSASTSKSKKKDVESSTTAIKADPSTKFFGGHVM